MRSTRSSRESGDRSDPSVLVLLLSLGATGAIFAIDLQIPLGVAVGVLYVPVIALSSLVLGRRPVLLLAMLTTTLTIVGWEFSPAGGIPWMAAVNALATVLAIWSVVICHIVRHHDPTQAAAHRATEDARTRQRWD